jgi:hypothetical protein
LEDILEELEDKEKVEEDNDDYDDLVAEVIDSEAREAWKKPRKDVSIYRQKIKGKDSSRKAIFIQTVVNKIVYSDLLL